MAKELRLGVGGVVLALTSVGDGSEFDVEEAYERFASEAQAEVMLRVEGHAILDHEFGERVFDSGGPWSLYHNQEGWTIGLRSPGSSPHPYQIAILEPDFRSGDIYMKAGPLDDELLPFPLRHPLAEVLMVNLLSLGRGVLVHAYGVNDRGRALIFAGSSGAGKSTMAELWKDEEGTSILSDDRIIVREEEGRFWAYGTPWHGDARLCSPESVPLEAIFFIRHDEENSVVPLEARKAVSSLLVRSFPTFWNAGGMAFTLDFLSRMSQEVPCYDLGFAPDKRIVQLVRSMDYA
ncbi:MAG: hypothetical protein WBB22_09425 [Anaerolineae bacterium]